MSNEITNATSSAYGTQGSSQKQVRDPKIWKTASDFEAMTVGQMLQPMFDTVDTSKGFFGGGVGESSFRPMLTTEMSKQIEKNGGLGFAPAVYHQMLEMQEKGTKK